MRKLLFLFCTVALTGCSYLYPSMMLRTPRNYPYSKLNDSIASKDYKLSINDYLSLRLYSQDGFRLIDFTNIIDNSGGSSGGYVTTPGSGVQYLVEPDGTVRLPVIGWVHVSGLTIREATRMLEQKFSQYYINPFILLEVTNRRVIVFPGDPGTARVVPLVNNNTTLMEVLAISGGITVNGKANQIKLIRGDPNNPNVYLIDLSKIYGIKAGNTILQEGDIIYITPVIRPAEQIVNRLSPTLTLISTLITLVLTVELLKAAKF